MVEIKQIAVEPRFATSIFFKSWVLVDKFRAQPQTERRAAAYLWEMALAGGAWPEGNTSRTTWWPKRSSQYGCTFDRAPSWPLPIKQSEYAPGQEYMSSASATSWILLLLFAYNPLSSCFINCSSLGLYRQSNRITSTSVLGHFGPWSLRS